MPNGERQIHNIDPVFDENSRVLILGSFPSVRSRAEGFFYAHPHNRFWPLLAHLAGRETPRTIEEKKELLLQNRIALWDSAASCTIAGSGDASIRDVVPNDVASLLSRTQVRAIFANGAAAGRLYARLIEPKTGIRAVVLPSTSAANAAWSFERLAEAWSVVRDEFLK